MSKLALLFISIILLGFSYVDLSYSQESPDVLPEQDDFIVNSNEGGGSPEAGSSVNSTSSKPVNTDEANATEVTVPTVNDPYLEGFFEDISYSPTDKRDPFLPYLTQQKIKIVNEEQDVPLEPLQKFALSELKIIGIIWDVGKPKALVLDPQGKSYIVTENAKMGKDFGYVAAIREGEIIVVEQVQANDGKKSFLTKILKLAKQ